jgi:hypothetical protein
VDKLQRRENNEWGVGSRSLGGVAWQPMAELA